jgi:hypothetical protein
MKQKDLVEVQVAATVKTVRSLIRMKYSLLADQEINETIPDIEEAAMAAAVEGKPFAPDYAAIFKGL